MIPAPHILHTAATLAFYELLRGLLYTVIQYHTENQKENRLRKYVRYTVLNSILEKLDIFQTDHCSRQIATIE